MKNTKLLSIMAATGLLVSPLHAVWVSSVADGDWTATSSWGSAGLADDYPDNNLSGESYDVNVFNSLTISQNITVNQIFLKPGSVSLTVSNAILTAASTTLDNSPDSYILLENNGQLVISNAINNTVRIAGGSINVTQNANINGAAKLVFGSKNSAGTFVAAEAHSAKAANKFNVNATAVFQFNLANSNLLTSSDAAILKDNAFMYSANEIEFHRDGTSGAVPTVEIDFVNMDFSALAAGEYFVSFFACERDFHTDVSPDFNYFDIEGNLVGIDFGTEYFFGDDVSFTITHDKSNYTYYMQMNIIPEPSTYAAIFGAMALALAAYGRRRK